jgi:hypothetical protein
MQQRIRASYSLGWLWQIIRKVTISRYPRGKDKTYARDQPTARPMIRSHPKIALMPAIALLIAGFSAYTLNSAETSAKTTGEPAAGFNAQRLHDGLQRFVDSGEYAGIVSLLMRGGGSALASGKQNP